MRRRVAKLRQTCIPVSVAGIVIVEEGLTDTFCEKVAEGVGGIDWNGRVKMGPSSRAK